MSLDFLADAQVAAYGGFQDTPPRADRERFFFLDDADKKLIAEGPGRTPRGPGALFDQGVGWLRRNRVLLPRIIVLTRLVTKIYEAATQRVHTTLADIAAAPQGAGLRPLRDPGDEPADQDLT